MAEEGLDKKGVLRAMFFAIIIALVGVGILGWQYRQIEKKRLPVLQEQIEKQKEEMEEREEARQARGVLDKFLMARVAGREDQAMRYLTEKAVQQRDEGEFSLLNKFKSYEILNDQRLGQNQFRFAVKIYEEELVGDFVEVITVVKILDKYYIDSVEIAG